MKKMVKKSYGQRKQIRLHYGSADPSENLCFERSRPPSSIDFIDLASLPIPADWGSSAGAGRAAAGAENLAKLMGRFTFDVSAEPHLVQELCRWTIVEDGNMFNEDGEFRTDQGQIPVSRLIDMTFQKKITVVDDAKHVTLNHIFTLQNPTSSRWKKPFIRVISNHVYDAETKVLSVKLYVYFTRLIFELIADPTVKLLVDSLEDKPFHITSTTKRDPQPRLFTVATDHTDFPRFSLTGLMKHAESSGYTLAKSQPKGLSVQLYDFQLSTYQWMLDQENYPRGLNGFFWEEWEVKIKFKLYDYMTFSTLKMSAYQSCSHPLTPPSFLIL